MQKSAVNVAPTKWPQGYYLMLQTTASSGVEVGAHLDPVVMDLQRVSEVAVDVIEWGEE